MGLLDKIKRTDNITETPAPAPSVPAIAPLSRALTIEDENGVVLRSHEEWAELSPFAPYYPKSNSNVANHKGTGIGSPNQNNKAP